MTGHTNRRRVHRARARRIEWDHQRHPHRRFEYKAVLMRLVKLDVQVFPDEPARYQGFWDFVRSTMDEPGN